MRRGADPCLPLVAGCVGGVRETFSPSVNSDLQHIIQSKEAERRRLRALPWLEKLEMLDRLRVRHLSLQRMQLRLAGTRLGSAQSRGSLLTSHQMLPAKARKRMNVAHCWLNDWQT